VVVLVVGEIAVDELVKPRAEHADADRDDEQPGGEAEPRVELSWTMYCESPSVTSPKAKTPTV
jgi:hypothetical protein